MSFDIKTQRFEEINSLTLYQLLKLRVDVFVVEQNCPYPELDDRDQGATHLYISSKNGIAAYLRIYFPEAERAAIGRVVVHKDFRKDGLGRKLMNEAMILLAKDKSIKTIYLQAQDYLLDFYQSFGFKATSEVYLEDGIPHVDMEKANG